MSNDKLAHALRPILGHLGSVDPADADGARRILEAVFPLKLPAVQNHRDLFRQGCDEGWLCDKEAGANRFSRVAKAGDATRGSSFDAVRLEGPGVWHRHTTEEVDLCLSSGGEARFDGWAKGSVVFPAGSDHVPTTVGGAMGILYFVPGGTLEWRREQSGASGGGRAARQRLGRCLVIDGVVGAHCGGEHCALYP